MSINDMNDDYYSGKIQYWLSQQHPIFAHCARGFIIFSGIAVILLGIILIPLPGPGWLIVFLGLSLVGTVSRPVDEFVKKIKNFIKQKFQKFVHKEKLR